MREIPVPNLSSYLQDVVRATGSGDVSLEDATCHVQKIRRYQNILDALLQQPQVAQRSPEWFDLRKNRLTASDVAQALNKGKFGTKQQLISKKAFPDNHPFITNPALQWGVMFEPMAERSYTQRHHDTKVYEFGLIPHPDISCFGASPDGITEQGIMLEFKCPLRRKIDGTIPEQYELQMQGQMAVCGLAECDYVECDMQRLSGVDEYLQLVPNKERRDHGIIIGKNVVSDDGSTSLQYMYSPPYLTPSEAVEWMELTVSGIQEEHPKIVIWKLRKINIMRVTFDETRWGEMIPLIQAFWQEVETARTLPPPDTAPGKTSGKRKKFEFIDDDES